MTELICFIERRDRGDRIARVRLLGRDLDAEWTPAAAAEEDPLAGPRAAAEWVRQRLGEAGAKKLEAVCIDPEGGVCAWMRPPTAAAGAVDAIIRRTGGEALLAGVDAEMAREGSEFGADEGSLLPDLTTPGSAGVQASGQMPGANGSAVLAPDARMTVLAMRDASVRVFLDGLDRAGVSVGRVESLWHAMARAWDAGGLHERSQGPEIVGQQSPMVGSVILQPSGRLAWCWSQGGELLAAGAARCAVRDEGPTPTPADAARLVGDWMAWGAQMGRVPQRVTCVLPEEMGGDAGAFGSALAGLWRDAPVDAMTADDPAKLTLERERGRPLPPEPADPSRRSRRRSVALAFLLIAAAGLGIGGTLLMSTVEGASRGERQFGLLAGGLASVGGVFAAFVAWRWFTLSKGEPAGSSAVSATRALMALSSRPGRTHRSMFRWTGVALLASGVLAGIVGWKLRDRAAETRNIAEGFRREVNQIYQRYGTEPASGGVAVLKMEQLVGTMKQRMTAPTGLPTAKPILQELDALMTILPSYGPSDELALQSLTLDDIGLRLTVHVPTLESFTTVREALRQTVNNEYSNLIDWKADQTVVNNIQGVQVRKADFSASWRADASRGGGS
ncbi:MAG: hypothetical protein ACF8SC_07460 [Phycisphaerales bacterium JB037]